MGILNLTSNSFYKGSRIDGVEMALDRAASMLGDGADILDLGAYSTRPGAEDVPVQREQDEIISTVKAIKVRFPESIISIDTFRASVAQAAIEAGAAMINDVGSGALDKDMFQAVAEMQVPYVLMHNRGNPQNMTKLASYKVVVDDVIRELSEKVNILRKLGVNDVIIDPGFGFAKTADQNFEILMRLEEFQIFDTPIMVGLSRKSMVWRTLAVEPGEALNGTTALHMLAMERGARLLRVHDVKPADEAIRLWKKCAQAKTD